MKIIKVIVSKFLLANMKKENVIKAVSGNANSFLTTSSFEMPCVKSDDFATINLLDKRQAKMLLAVMGPPSVLGVPLHAKITILNKVDLFDKLDGLELEVVAPSVVGE